MNRLVRRAIRGQKGAYLISSMKQQMTDDLSQYGQGLGYCGSLTVTIITAVILFSTAQTQYAQYDGYGVTSGDGIESFDELWLKKVWRTLFLSMFSAIYFPLHFVRRFVV